MTSRGLGFDLQFHDALQRLSKDHLPRDPGSTADLLEGFIGKELQA